MSVFDDVDVHYKERKLRARELRSSGKKIVGYFCCFVPVEILTAMDLVPYRIQGSVVEPIERADSCLEIYMCPYVRSCFDLALKDEYDFLDGLVVPHSCDTIQRIYDIWKHYRPPQYYHLLNVPHMLQPSSYEFYKNELQTFIKSLEKFTGQRMTRENLRQAVQLHNENRSVLRQLYELRKPVPPLVSGTEVTKVLIVGMGIPVKEHTDLVTRFIIKVKERPRSSNQKLPRILVYGNEIDDIAFIKLVEDTGANVVMDDLCTGSRFFWQDVKLTDDPLDGIVNRYLGGVYCPRSYIPQGKTRQEDLDNRLGYLRNFVTEFKVNGAIFYIIRYCDTYELDVPDVRDYLRGQGIPVLSLEDEYSMTTIGQLRTRVQAFLEMIS